jgi:hypothetical protein
VSGTIYHMPPGVDRPQVTGIFTDESAKFSHFFPPSSFAHRRDVVDRIGAWRDAHEIKPPVDVELLLRATQAGLRFKSTMRITAHKFAAGHRYLSYVRHDSSEQESMLARVSEPGFDAYVEGLVDLSRATGGYMALRYRDFERYAPGQLASENAARKGVLRPPLVALRTQQIVPQPRAALALDWGKMQPNGLRWAKLNPRPKLLIPFTAEGPAVVRMTLAHEHPVVLQTLRLLANGESIPVRVGAAAQVSDHWQVVATFEVRLATDDYTMLELELEGDQIAKGETRGLGIGQIVIGP